MPTIDEANKRLDTLSGHISTLVRTLALGVLALTWLFLSGDTDAPAVLNGVPAWQLVAISGMTIIALAADLVQYVAGYKSVLKARDEAKAERRDVIYPDDWLSKTRNRCFWIKQGFALGAAAWLVIALAAVVLGNLVRTLCAN